MSNGKATSKRRGCTARYRCDAKTLRRERHRQTRQASGKPERLFRAAIELSAAMLRWADKCAEEAYRYLKLDALDACMIADRETALKRIRKENERKFLAALAVPEHIGLMSDMQLFGGAGKSASDYVTRRFKVSSAQGLKKRVGLGLRWKAA